MNPDFERVRKFLYNNLFKLHDNMTKILKRSPKLIDYILEHPRDFYELFADVSNLEDIDVDADFFEMSEGTVLPG